MNIILVAIGGAIGAVLRYAISASLVFPVGTLVVNVVGSFLMGALFVFLTAKGLDKWAPLLLSGMLGGFTTFSAFSLDVLKLFEAGRLGSAGGYIAASVMLSIVAVFAGVLLIRTIMS